MLSYHPVLPPPPPVNKKEDAKNYRWGFETVDTGDLDFIARGICVNCWSPIVWDGGRSLKTKFLHADWLVLDFDDGMTTIEQAQNIFCDMINIIGTTMSHRIDGNGDRFRVVIPFAEQITSCADYRHTVLTAIKKYSGDESGADGGRFFYPCREIVSVNSDGDKWETLRAPDPVKVAKRRAALVRAGVLSRFARITLKEVWPKGIRNNTCYMMACELTRAGYDFDEILDLILKSPTYNDQDNPPLDEMHLAIGNGVRDASAELVLPHAGDAAHGQIGRRQDSVSHAVP